MSKLKNNPNDKKLLLKFIGDDVTLDEYQGLIIWGGTPDDQQRIADVRGWGKIMNMFRNPDNSTNMEDSEKFQDNLGQFIVDAIKEKVAREKDSKEFNLRERAEIVKIAQETSKSLKAGKLIDYFKEKSQKLV